MPDDASLPGQVAPRSHPTAYSRLAAENKRRYGTEWGRIGRPLLADRYAERTHFVYELLQNAEDALRKRPGWTGARSVRFELRADRLLISHYGKPFDGNDVRGVCGISESTKDLTAIGRFGIGFKSVNAVSDRPEVHSGAEDFAIEGFIEPVAVPPVERGPDETVIVLPLRATTDRPTIAKGLASLGSRALLFLCEIDRIDWDVEGGASGSYSRHSSEPSFQGEMTARQVRVRERKAGEPEVEEDWLLFSRPMSRIEGDQVGQVELGFRLEAGSPKTLRRADLSPLYVFFPTVVETHLGFLLQGPLRTTPSRDAIPQDDEWNIQCVRNAGDLLVEALLWLRASGMLDTAALECLPLVRSKFEGGMFMPLLERARAALQEESLLPAHGSGYVPAREALLARGQGLRDLLEDGQLGTLFANGGSRRWLTGRITQDRTPGLYRFLMAELDVAEVTPSSLLTRLDADFLERQPDAWIERLYAFLGEQPNLSKRATETPLVRLTDGSHVRPQRDGVPQAFLPGAFESGFPTVRPEVCASEEARSFLESLGLDVADQVDDVLRNVLSKYRKGFVKPITEEYATDIERILAAYATDSKSQQEKLVARLRDAEVVKCVSAEDGRCVWVSPQDAFLPTERLKELLSGIPGVYIVDERCACLSGQELRGLLERCGASRCLRPIKAPDISPADRRDLREKIGHSETSGYRDRVTDHTLLGLDEIISKLGTLPVEERRRQAEFLWEELQLVEDRRGKGVFTSEYTWTHNGSYSARFPATFIRILNEKPWVPNRDGEPCKPGSILFEELGWQQNPFLASLVSFKPPIIAELAQKAGIDAEVLELIKELDLTTAAELRSRLGIEPVSVLASAGPDRGSVDATAPSPEPPAAGLSRPAMAKGAVGSVIDQNLPDGAGTLEASAAPRDIGSHTGPWQALAQLATSHSAEPSPSSKAAPPLRNAAAAIPPQHAGSAPSEESSYRDFVSFVGVRRDDHDADPEGLSQSERMAIEERAIAFILTHEPAWRRTPPGNAGYDLFKPDAAGQPCEWCEVKAMTQSLDQRPVGISRRQFQFASEKGVSFWLYVVENAATDHANLVKIRDPAGQARTFTFDRGWRDVAMTADQFVGHAVEE